MRQAIVLHLATLPALLSGIACGPVHPQIHADFIEGLKHGTTVTVLPAAIRQETRTSDGRDASERIAAHLRSLGVDARVGYAQGRTRYVLAPEFLIGSDGTVLGVTVTVVRADGELAALLSFDPQDPLFQSVKPTTREACTGLVLAAIDDKWVTR